MDNKVRQFSQALTPVETRAPLPPQPAAPARWQAVTEEPEPAGGLDLRDYWRVIHGSRWTIAISTAATIGLALIYNFVSVPTYRASVTLRIDREEPNLTDVGEKPRRLPEAPDYLETQYKILKSRTLAKRVITKLELDSRPEFNRDVPKKGAGAFRAAELPPGLGPGNPGRESVYAVHPAIIDSFQESLEVNPGKGTRLVEAAFESVDRRLAPRVANSLAEEYIEYNLETRWKATQRASGWLQKELSALRSNLEDSEARLLDYATRHSILFVEERKNITTEKLAQLEDELTRAQAERIEKQSLALLVEDALRRGSEMPGSLTSRSYQDLQAKLIELRQQLSHLLVQFEDGYPKVRQVRSQMVEIELALEAERKRILSGVRESFELARNRSELLRAEVLRQRQSVNQLSDDFIQYNILKRDSEANRELYEGLLQRLKEAGISAGLRASNIAVLDPAEIPLRAYRPKWQLNILIASLMGLTFGVALSFVQERFNTQIRTPDEVERATGLNLLALIPRSRDKEERKLLTRRLSESAAEPVEESRPVAGRARAADSLSRNGRPGPSPAPKEQWAPAQDLAEAYRSLRSSILLGAGEDGRRILVTSSQPQEGKTTVSLNLACSLAQLGRKVLLIDADLRRPNCDKQLGVEASRGLTEFLEGRVEPEEIICATKVEGLWLAPAGRASGRASDLLSSPRLAQMLQEAGGNYDHVVVDSPPSLVLSDARTISRIVEGVIIVVSDQTDRGALMRTKQTLDDAGAHCLGFVMNRINLDRDGYSYYRDYGYYYSYREEHSS